MKLFVRCGALCAAFLSLGLCGCGGNSDTDNTGKSEPDLACATTALPDSKDAQPGILVYVSDAVTKKLVFEDTVVTVTDGSYTETLQSSVNTGVTGVGVYASFFGVYERPGTYLVTVTSPRYATAKKTVTVTRDTVLKDTCHVGVQRLSIALEPK